ncbi:YihA family ribosome biogenesis GTP-binding protein [Carboxylicivirga sp. A043]|uniref:ribosome biogenesis GTP-binding protein YihA/YsxC n=1 Tax=Carboxylicivirga litoralis TaxID=2816963 RepID=UPI0021CB198A|nr:ribosome biogenesis GTP-binding protein YihA/YsxC [Carboxylicivirga sp. A043]MCU4154789.1 YihA family ribosome biogenesis GTP-binding protein [Carboxylicivirga sp. A043]
MEILSAQFHKSSAKASQCPKEDRPEYAFIGRSNVGKSSLINKLCKRKALAKISSTPGKTQLINHFDIDGKWYLVDLPGFGYAKVSKTIRSTFGALITDYISNRKNLMCLFVLIDSRIPMQEIDLVFMNSMVENGVPIAIVFTKTDKLNKTQYATNMKAYEEKLLEYWEELPPVFYTSAKSGDGSEAVLDFIEDLNSKW